MLLQYVLSFRKQFIWCAYWVGLGILSSVGLGTGLHTFVLYLVSILIRCKVYQYFLQAIPLCGSDLIKSGASQGICFSSWKKSSNYYEQGLHSYWYSTSCCLCATGAGARHPQSSQMWGTRWSQRSIYRIHFFNLQLYPYILLGYAQISPSPVCNTPSTECSMHLYFICLCLGFLFKSHITLHYVVISLTCLNSFDLFLIARVRILLLLRWLLLNACLWTFQSLLIPMSKLLA